MIYIVSGYRRCGTSAMMSVLIEGGIPAIYNPLLEQFNVGNNPGPLYELGRFTYMEPEYLSQALAHGHAYKIFFDGLPTLPVFDGDIDKILSYRIIFMQRDEEDINASLEKALKNIENAGNIPQRGGRKPFDVYSPYNQKHIDWVIDICKQRRDMNLSVVNFDDLISKPKETIESLNLPIDESAYKTIKRK